MKGEPIISANEAGQRRIIHYEKVVMESLTNRSYVPVPKLSKDQEERYNYLRGIQTEVIKDGLADCSQVIGQYYANVSKELTDLAIAGGLHA